METNTEAGDRMWLSALTRKIENGNRKSGPLLS